MLYSTEVDRSTKHARISYRVDRYQLRSVVIAYFSAEGRAMFVQVSGCVSAKSINAGLDPMYGCSDGLLKL